MPRALGRLAALVCTVIILFCPLTQAATIGTVVPVVGSVSDLVYDEQRDLVYLSNFTENRVEVYSVGGRRIIATIPTGLQPAALALSPNRQTLYAANFGANTLTVIDLNSQAASADVPLGQRPDALAIGNDGRVLVLGSAGLSRFDPGTSQLFQLAISPPPAAPPGLPVIPPSQVPIGFRAAMRTSGDGNIIVGISNNRIFVYEVASASVLRSRNVTGLIPIVSVNQDGSRFMAGPFLFDGLTLTILGRAAFAVANLAGGSAFSVDGNTVYSSFTFGQTDRPVNALNPNQISGATTLPGQQRTLGILQVMRTSGLTPQLGLRLPEAITSRIITSSDGQNLFALCTSGLLVIPIGQLNRLPILDVSSRSVVLSVDICNRGIVTADVEVRNIGGGRLTFAATANNVGAGQLQVTARSGVAPASVQIRFDASRTTTRGTQQFAVILNSPEAVNVEPVILVNLNFRDVNQRGTIKALEGLGVDMVMDESRQRIYIADLMDDEIEVFSLVDREFMPPIRVGAQPRAIALVNSSTMVVANSAAESVSVVDLDSMQEVDVIPMAPVPLGAAPFFPRAIAVSSNAILFSAVPLTAPGANPGNGSVWQLSLATRSAFPRLNLGGTTANNIQGRNFMVAPANGSAIVVAEGNGNLRLYDPVGDTFPITRTGAVAGMRGTASVAADGSFYIFDNMVFNSVLSPRGSLVPAGAPGQTATAFGVTAAGADALRVQAADAQVPVQRLQRVNLNVFQAQQEFRLPEAVMDITPGGTGAAFATRLWPPTPIQLLLGVRGTTFLWPRGMAVDSRNQAYILSISGLMMVPLDSVSGRGPTFSAAGVVNGASFRGPVAPGSIISIFGTDLGETVSAGSTPLPRILNGVCVTANDVSLPLFYTSPTQINAQLPPEIAAGRVTLTVNSAARAVASTGVQVTVNATAPGVFTTTVNDQQRAILVHPDFTPVTPDNPGRRDRDLILFATGLGRVTPVVAGGLAAPISPLSITASPVSVTIGGHPMMVTWSGLAPGFVGLYQINIRVPGDRVQGDDLPVVVSVGGVTSPTTNAPLAAIR